MTTPKIFEVISELKKDVLSGKISKDDRVELGDDIAKETVMDSPLGEVVEIAESLGFNAEFSPNFIFGSDILWSDERGLDRFEIRFLRPGFIDYESSKDIARFSFYCLLTNYHINHFSENEKARFYRWMSPFTCAAMIHRGSVRFYDRENARQAVINGIEMKPGYFREIEEAAKHKDVNQTMKVALNQVIKGADIFDVIDLEFWLRRDGTTHGVSINGRDKGISIYGPRIIASPLHECLYPKNNRDDHFSESVEIAINGEGKELSRKVIDAIDEAEIILRDARNMSNGYRFQMSRHPYDNEIRKLIPYF